MVLVNLLEYKQVMLKFLIQQIAELQILEQELGSLKKNAVCIIIFFRILESAKKRLTLQLNNVFMLSCREYTKVMVTAMFSLLPKEKKSTLKQS